MLVLPLTYVKSTNKFTKKYKKFNTKSPAFTRKLGDFKVILKVENLAECYRKLKSNFNIQNLPKFNKKLRKIGQNLAEN